MLADVRHRWGLGLLLAVALAVMTLMTPAAGAGSARSDHHAARVAAVAQSTAVVASLGHAVERGVSAAGHGHRSIYSPPSVLGLATAALLLLLLVAAAVSGFANGLGRRRLRDRAPPSLS